MQVELSISDLKVIEMHLLARGEHCNPEVLGKIQSAIQEIETKEFELKGWRNFKLGEIVEVGDAWGLRPSCIFNHRDTRENYPDNSHCIGEPVLIGSYLKIYWKKIK